MVTAWLVTLPLAGVVGATTYLLVHAIGGYLGVILGFALLAMASLVIWLRSRRVRIDPSNVNDDWQGSLTGGIGAPGDAAGAPAAPRTAATFGPAPREVAAR